MSSCKTKATSGSINNHPEQDSSPHSETNAIAEVVSSKVSRGDRKQSDASEVPTRRHSPLRQNSNGRWFIPFGHSTITATTASPILPQFRANIPLGSPHPHFNYYQYSYNTFHPPFYPPGQRRRLQRTMAPFDNNSIDTTFQDYSNAVRPPDCTTSNSGPPNTHDNIYHKVSYDEDGVKRPSPTYRRQYSYSASFPSPVYTLPYEYNYDTPPNTSESLAVTAADEHEITSTTSTPLKNNHSSSKAAAIKAATAAADWQYQPNGEYYLGHFNGQDDMRPHSTQPFYRDYYGDSLSREATAPTPYWNEALEHRDPSTREQRPPPSYYYYERRETDHGYRYTGYSYSREASSWGYFPNNSSESFDDGDEIPIPPATPYSPMARSAPPKVTPSTGTSIRHKSSQEDHNDNGIMSNILKSSSSNTPSVHEDYEPSREKMKPIKTSSTSSASPIGCTALGDMDIVVGRGAPTNYHIGNEAFRQLVTEYHTTYFCAKRSDKPLIALEVLDVLKERGSRFVRRQKGGGAGGRNAVWVEVNKKLAYEKVCAALRDGAPQVQRRLLSSETIHQPSNKGYVGEVDDVISQAGYHPTANIFSEDGSS
ncbi:hypothetical protein IV203_010516 [Nitzschia inconspicua]|uniref:DUF6824 domain-containing protein n=1 Tax=Nitzschia inconspicua TaxID=303405 RepID=A0A9K3KX12_9STRA|nr:hypothetical protein IV203_010516 [Nitzschia inconspicua]